MKKIIQFAVDYPVTIVMMVCAVLLLGYISFQRLGMDLFPELRNPRLYVEIRAGDEPPEDIETQYVERIEAQAIRQKNALEVSSISTVGAARITVEYAWDTAMDEAYLDLQKALLSFQQNTDIEELTISQVDPNATPIVLVGLSHPEITDMDQLRQIAENYIRNELIRLEGIADVRLYGQEEKEVIIETDQYLLEAFNLTPAGLAGRITDYNRDVSGGSIVEMGTKYIVKGVSTFRSLEDIARIIVAYRNADANETSATGQVPVFLEDVANIRLANKEPDNIVHVNGERCMALAVYKETRYNTVNAVNDLLESLETIRQALPGYELTVIQNRGAFITDAINEVQQTLLYGIGLAVFVLFVFLRRIGATAIISFAIPISIIATFNLMYYNELTLNIMTLGGLALGAGMLVDNAIVVMENIFRNLEEGLPLRDAAITGTSQVSGAITASTVTTIVVFLPIVYMHGSAGELFKDQAWTVAFSLISSLGVAMLVIPMLSTRLLKPGTPAQSGVVPVHFPRYAALLRHLLRLRWFVIALAACLVAASAWLVPRIGSEFIPKTDLNEFTVEITLPEGTDLLRTESTVKGIEKNIAATYGEQIEMLYSIVGYAGDLGEADAATEGENTALIQLRMKPSENLSAAAVQEQLTLILDSIPELESNVYQEQTAMQLTLGEETAPVVVEIQGDDLDVIQELTAESANRLSLIDGLMNIETNFDDGRPEISVVIDRLRAGAYNVNIANVSTQLQTLLMGADAGQWDTGGELRNITIKTPRMSVSQLDEITVTGGGKTISLSEIADIEVSTAPKEIYRRNQSRIGRITAHLREDIPLDRMAAVISVALADISASPDYRIAITGEEEKRREAFDNLRFALILSFILVYMVLASQFESLIHPLTILLSVPMAGVGAVAIFYIFGQSFNIMALIGMILLVGIAVNNAILLVDTINQLRRTGLERYEAVVEAGRRRIRPIIMTSLTTILALLPLTVGFGEGAALRAPMAMAVIGGLFTSTLLTLVVIPCLYVVLDKLARPVEVRE